MLHGPIDLAGRPVPLSKRDAVEILVLLGLGSFGVCVQLGQSLPVGTLGLGLASLLFFRRFTACDLLLPFGFSLLPPGLDQPPGRPGRSRQECE